MDLSIFERIIASSPAIVGILFGACVILWRKLEAKDATIEALQREVLTAVAGVTSAVVDLQHAIERIERR
ncbi:hypothetical protein [Roseococcus sp.]|uniref:hypothetical protein n=1 Tax=Roseococcus sp. TaxID=2109646 RepID=UPI003BACF417